MPSLSIHAALVRAKLPASARDNRTPPQSQYVLHTHSEQPLQKACLQTFLTHAALAHGLIASAHWVVQLPGSEPPPAIPPSCAAGVEEVAVVEEVEREDVVDEGAEVMVELEDVVELKMVEVENVVLDEEDESMAERPFGRLNVLFGSTSGGSSTPFVSLVAILLELFPKAISFLAFKSLKYDCAATMSSGGAIRAIDVSLFD